MKRPGEPNRQEINISRFHGGREIFIRGIEFASDDKTQVRFEACEKEGGKMKKDWSVQFINVGDEKERNGFGVFLMSEAEKNLEEHPQSIEGTPMKRLTLNPLSKQLIKKMEKFINMSIKDMWVLQYQFLKEEITREEYMQQIKYRVPALMNKEAEMILAQLRKDRDGRD